MYYITDKGRKKYNLKKEINYRVVSLYDEIMDKNGQLLFKIYKLDNRDLDKMDLFRGGNK